MIKNTLNTVNEYHKAKLQNISYQGTQHRSQSLTRNQQRSDSIWKTRSCHKIDYSKILSTPLNVYKILMNNIYHIKRWKTDDHFL